MPAPDQDPLSLELYDQPGHLIRRAQQIAVSMFHEQLGTDVTPIQYAVLRTLQDVPGVDQVTLAGHVALDTSTTAELAARLEAKGWIVREMLPRRQRSLHLTDAGRAVLERLVPGMQAMQRKLLGRFNPEERREFLRLLRKFVQLNNDASRAPLQRPLRGDDERAAAKPPRG
jgi:MarR family transcriptional regulator, temperature-dependent positive regulator of motility